MEGLILSKKRICGVMKHFFELHKIIKSLSNTRDDGGTRGQLGQLCSGSRRVLLLNELGLGRARMSWE